ncbi:MAG TPA: hypothetical protein PKC99_17940 [Anaerolineales bacterium]|jgi:6-phosphogluconate dehydrogenase|nr:MAG: hypothetical protein DCC59_01145 [Chloroflexota bacterium]HMN00889.1 hypothetical protein [Anaerolineales bacterium]
MKKMFSVLSIFVAAAVLMGSAAFPSTALAMPAADPLDDALAKAYQAEQQWLAQQQEHIAKLEQAAVKVQELIDKAVAEGYDVSALQSALAAFNSSMTSAKAEYQTAADLLAAHNGFDDQGNVTDRQSARQTLLNARQSLRQAHLTMSQAAMDLRQAVSDWRQANFPQGG